MRDVAYDLKVKSPTDNDILAILQELDEDNNNSIDKEEFVKLIIMVFEKMLENETDLILNIQQRNLIREQKQLYSHNTSQQDS
mmetsp:Transcript_16480/g.27984  ORF Transcript_16480/g.27984 Transcript_16480/m.27984 type:complete len:83 (-) Transcript_16480:64-312(-)